MAAKIDELEAGVLDARGRPVVARIGKDGKEYGDPRPLAPPVGFDRPETQAEIIRRMVRREFSAAAQEQGFETFEEAEDFDIPDDPADPHTPYEAVFDPPLERKDDGVASSGTDDGRVAVGDKRGRESREARGEPEAEPGGKDGSGGTQRDAGKLDEEDGGRGGKSR